MLTRPGGALTEVFRGICSSPGSVIGHHRIQVEKPELFRSDGVHLSDAGMDVFLEEIKAGLLVELERLSGEHET